ncbi:MAG: segregation/condensation protein A [Clostridia bacterium]|nr:segregation/condensation protein A [Clostridia bacterium]
MEIIQQEIESELNYKVRLDNFEGPLDLLLHLIKETKMDITDIRLSEITNQYMKYLEQVDGLDLEKASEFIEMAATLLEIKSKKLLPRLDEVVPEEEDSEQRLIRQIEEYKIFKEASENLKNIENINRLYKEAEPSANKCKIIIKDMVLDNLLDAFASLLHKVQVKTQDIEPKNIAKDRFTISEKIAAIKDSVMIKGKIKFSELIDENITRSEVINVFLAVLELLKSQTISIVQNSIFEDIEITQNIDYQTEEAL